MNCINCIKYDSNSTDKESDKCKLAYHLDMGNITGDIPLWVAKQIGYKYDPLYGHVRLDKTCREFRDGSEPF